MLCVRRRSSAAIFAFVEHDATIRREEGLVFMIQDVTVKKLVRHLDDHGFFMEVLRDD